MSGFGFLGIGPRLNLWREPPAAVRTIANFPLKRILAFRARTIDDVVNNPVVKNEVLAYWKLQKRIEAMTEVLELEQQWNNF